MNKIDFVIPWVDGDDPAWQAEKAEYSGTMVRGDDARDIRYRDFDLLRYWFRGVEKYAPWVNQIYFITWGHLPEWLDTSNPKLKIVNHKDYIPEEYRPTFSSHTIELNMHRIEGLSENFVYFNDDIFILNPLKEEDFFRDDKPCDCLVQTAITPQLSEFSAILVENTGVINKHFTKKDIKKLGWKKTFNPKYGKLNIRTLTTLPYHFIMGIYNPHICFAHKKSTFDKVWEEEFEELDATCKHRFRGRNDVNQYIMRYWNLCSGNFYPQAPIGPYITLHASADQIAAKINDKKNKVIAINDAMVTGDLEAKIDRIHKELEAKFPEKSAFEL